MSRKVLGGVLLLVGIVLVVAGVVVMFVVVPGMKRFPDDVDTTRLYEGTMPVLLDAQNLEFMTDLDVQLKRHLKTEETDGDTALVLEEQTLTAGDRTLLQNVYHYAIDRKTMEAVNDFPESWAQKPGLWPREGLVIGWPIDTEKKDYVGWSDNYRQTISFSFTEEVTHDRSGLKTYHFASSGEAAPIPAEAVAFSGLPTELTHEQVQALVNTFEGVNPMVVAALPTLLQQAEWPDPVPLAFTYEYEAEYWVEPQTGVLIDTHKIEIRRVGFPDEQIAALREKIEALPFEVNPELVDQLLSPVVVSHLDYRATDQAVQDAKKDAEDAISQLEMFGTILPLAMIGVGLVLLIVGGYLALRKA